MERFLTRVWPLPFACVSETLATMLVEMVLYGSWAWTEENTFPPWASIVKAPFWHLRCYTDLRIVLLHLIADPAVTLDSALNLVTVCTGTAVLL